MKKKISIIALVMVALLAFTACSNDTSSDYVSFVDNYGKYTYLERIVTASSPSSGATVDITTSDVSSSIGGYLYLLGIIDASNASSVNVTSAEGKYSLNSETVDGVETDTFTYSDVVINYTYGTDSTAASLSFSYEYKNITSSTTAEFQLSGLTINGTSYADISYSISESESSFGVTSATVGGNTIDSKFYNSIFLMLVNF